MSLASTLGFLACVVEIASYVRFRVNGDFFYDGGVHILMQLLL